MRACRCLIRVQHCLFVSSFFFVGRQFSVSSPSPQCQRAYKRHRSRESLGLNLASDITQSVPETGYVKKKKKKERAYRAKSACCGFHFQGALLSLVHTCTLCIRWKYLINRQGQLKREIPLLIMRLHIMKLIPAPLCPVVHGM